MIAECKRRKEKEFLFFTCSELSNLEPGLATHFEKHFVLIF